jgi:hypothetical protein
MSGREGGAAGGGAMPPRSLHPGNLIALLRDPQRMESAQGELIQAVASALKQSGASLDRSAVVVHVAPGDKGVQLLSEIVAADVENAALWPLLRTVHLVAAGIFELVKDKAHDDETAFDAALTRTREVLSRHGLDTALAPLFAETATAAIHAQAFAQATLFTVYPDGRLLAIKGATLARLMQAYQRDVAQKT